MYRELKFHNTSDEDKEQIISSLEKSDIYPTLTFFLYDGATKYSVWIDGGMLYGTSIEDLDVSGLVSGYPMPQPVLDRMALVGFSAAAIEDIHNACRSAKAKGYVLGELEVPA